MKKLFICLLISLLFLTGCHKKEKGITTLKAQQVIDKYENGDSFMLYVGQGACDFCKEYSDTLKHIIEVYDINIYYFSYDEIEENETLVNRLINDYLYQLHDTPTSYVVINGKSQENIVGNMTYTEVKQWLARYDLIKLTEY